MNGYFTDNSAGYAYYPISPCRIADTRNSNGTFGGPILAAQQSRSFPVVGTCGIPANAKAAYLNTTLVPGNPVGYLTVYPSGESQPTVSTMNDLDGYILGNGGIFKLGTVGSDAGKINLFVTDQTHVVIDVAGYFAPLGNPGAMTFNTLNPCRGIASDFSTNPREFAISGSCPALPLSTSSYAGNFTLSPSSPVGFLTVWPTGQSLPLFSIQNALQGEVVNNGALTATGVSGHLNGFINEGAAGITFDLTGYFTPVSTGGSGLQTQLSDSLYGPTGSFPGRFEPSTASGVQTSGAITRASAYYEYNLGTVFRYWNAQISSWTTSNAWPIVDGNVVWDATRKRFFAVGLDSGRNVLYGYSLDESGTQFAFNTGMAGSYPLVFQQTSTQCWDYPTIAVDTTGRVAVGAVAFPNCGQSGNTGLAYVLAMSPNTTTQPNAGQLLFTASPPLILPSATGAGRVTGQNGRVIAAGNRFHAFLARIDDVMNTPTQIYRYESPQPGSSQWSSAIAVTSEFTPPYNSTVPLDDPYTGSIFFAPILAASGNASGQWAVTFQLLGGAINGTSYNQVGVCTSSLFPCFIPNVEVGHQFLASTVIEPSGGIWSTYHIYQSPSVRPGPLTLKGVYTPPYGQNVGLIIKTGIDPTGWTNSNRCAGAPSPCFSLGDFATISSAETGKIIIPFMDSVPSPTRGHELFIADVAVSGVAGNGLAQPLLPHQVGAYQAPITQPSLTVLNRLITFEPITKVIDKDTIMTGASFIRLSGGKAPVPNSGPVPLPPGPVVPIVIPVKGGQ